MFKAPVMNLLIDFAGSQKERPELGYFVLIYRFSRFVYSQHNNI